MIENKKTSKKIIMIVGDNEILTKFVEYLLDLQITRVEYNSFDVLFGEFLSELDFSIPYTQFKRIREDSYQMTRWINIELTRRYFIVNEIITYDE